MFAVDERYMRAKSYVLACKVNSVLGCQQPEFVKFVFERWGCSGGASNKQIKTPQKHRM